MKLTFDEIKAVTTGYVSAAKKDGRLYFEKCTEKQVDFWYAQSKSLGERAEATTGVRFDFTTNSKRFYARVADGKYEVRINGVIVSRTTDGVIDIPLSGDNDRVTVIFPSHSRGYVDEVVLDDGAVFAPRRYDTKILFIGDSITQGWNSEYDGLSFAYRVTDFFDAESRINGIGGAYFAGGSFDTSDFDPDIVVVAYGCNDFAHYKTADERARHADEFLALVKAAYADKKLFYVVPIMRRDVTGERLDEFLNMRKGFEKSATEHGFVTVDGLAAVPDLADFYADDLHPNDLGFASYAEYLIKKIQEQL